MKWSAAILVVLVAAGCAPKERDAKVVVVRDAGATTTQESHDSLQRIAEFVRLYFEGDSITRSGLLNLLEKNRDKLAKFLAGTTFTPSDLVELLFAFDADRDGRLSLREAADGLWQRFSVLKWIPEGRSVDAAALDAALAAEFPAASIVARGALTGSLLRFDELWAEGNGDGLVSRRELQMAGMLLGVLKQTDFSKPVVAPPGGTADEQRERQAMVELLRHKIDQQLFGRYAESRFERLPVADAQLEWMKGALDFYLADKLVHMFAPDGNVPPADQALALSTFGPHHLQRWTELRRFYGHQVMGGDGNRFFSTTETFNLATDLRYAESVFIEARGEFSGAALTKLDPTVRARLFGSLLAVFPRVGADLFTTTGLALPVNSQYWDGLVAFDGAVLGGDGNGRIDAGELALALGYVKLSESLYALYDIDSDKVLSRREALPLFRQLGITDSRVVDAFFADIGLGAGYSQFWARLRLFFSGARRRDNLTPFEFYKRLVKVIPRLVRDDHS